MKKVMILFVVTLFFAALGTSFAQVTIAIDGDSTDWAQIPVAATALNNLPDYFPDEVGAITSDRVDIKTVKAVIQGNMFFFFIRFQGGPVWPNKAYEEDFNGTPVVRSRGYYHLNIDLDNNPDTGANTHWYEAHYTPVGYYNSQGLPNTDAIGSDGYLEFGIQNRWSPPKEDGTYKQVSYASYDISDVDYHTGLGDEQDISNVAVQNPDSSDAMMWQGCGINEITGDSTRYFWAGHAWGYDFLEYGTELTQQIEYWHAKGMDYFAPGDTIGIAGFIETPIDGWGVDVSPRGVVVVPEIPMRPSTITFDGQDDDWADQPVLATALDNLPDYFPDEVGAITSDRVDIKTVKAFIENDMFYWKIQFQGGPVWPNHAYEEVFNDTAVVRSRGYYHLNIDLDNNPDTGANTHWYEAHYTPVGYYNSQGLPNMDAIGSDGYLEFGIQNRWSPPKEDGTYKQVSYAYYDISDVDYHTGLGDEADIAHFEVVDPDSMSATHFSGYMRNDIVPEDLNFYYAGHAWGPDFLEYGVNIKPMREYWAAKGFNYLAPGDTIGVAGFIETPIDGWGVDVSPRGEFVVGAGTGVASRDVEAPRSFELGNNYPNPFNPDTHIQYYVPRNANVTLEVFNALGQKVRTLVDGNITSGNHAVTWNGRNESGELVSSGLYFYTLKSADLQITKRMVFLQ